MELEAIFLQLLNMSITAGYVIIAVLFIRLCIRRLPKIYSYILWSVVAFRLLCPFSFSSAYSFFNLHYFNEMENTGMGIQYVTAETEEGEKGGGPVMRDETLLPSADAVPNGAETPETVQLMASGTDWKEELPGIFSIVWIAGIGILLLYTVREIGKVKKQTADAVLAEGNIYESDRITQPFVFGIVRPRIYIPFRLQGKEREYILGHEQYHVHRKDYLVKGLAYGLAIVYWFHPLVWAAYYFMCQDMEMSCDEKVISSHGSEIKQSYGRLLLSFATGKRKLAGPLSFGESNVGKRIRNVLKFKRTGITAAVLCVILLAGLCMVFATNAKSGKGEEGRVTFSVTEEQPVLSSTMLSEEYVKGEFEFTDEIESYLFYADIYKNGSYEGRKVIVSQDIIGREENFAPVTGVYVNVDGGDTEGKQSSIVISYNTGTMSRTSNIPLSEKAVAVAADNLWMDGKSHEVWADTPYIYMAEYIGWGDVDEIECYRCENLNKADEEEWNHCIDQKCITVLLYFVFSEKKQGELLREYNAVPGNSEADLQELEAAKTEAEQLQEMAEAELAALEKMKMEKEQQLEAAKTEAAAGETELSAVMDRIVGKYWDNGKGSHGGDYTWNDFLMDCKGGNEDILWEDHLVYFDGAGGRADVYGVISPEFGAKGIIIDYKEKAGDDSNTNYFDWDWDVHGFCPQLEMADFDRDGREELFLKLCGEKDPDILYRERLFICETYETCRVEPYELTSEMIESEAKVLLETEIIADEHRVKISEKGTGDVLIPKFFYPGEAEAKKVSYSDFVWVNFDEGTGQITLVVDPVVYFKYGQEVLQETGLPHRLRTESEFLEFTVRYDDSPSLDGGYFTLSYPSHA